MVLPNIVILWPNINLEKIYNWKSTLGDAIIFNFQIAGLDLTGYQIRGEIYDLNTSVRLADSLGGPISAPEIIVTDATNGKFTAHVATGLTATMQKYSQVEFSLIDPDGNKTTIIQQAIWLHPERIIWASESQGVTTDTNEMPLF
jgi:hypothetical protein